ncbi:Fe/S biogenesis protein NfuA [Mycolicibacterium vanbaalenii]|uniref:Fe/S biogenesis protein NfuA n=1 Tax=Mycolicibacterium vanbaalenii TaxID=110539 RepID=A0A5S9R793_MYCVN|nr:NifU family protein [Mycolicibacterium vanbaalenii]CAA0130483.1 Fe/S biogenesis protein NfuA [Mycolicibacterium vanbaalenii]
MTDLRDAAASELEALATRVDAAVAALGDLEPTAKAAAEELKAALEDIHRAGLVTIVQRMRADDGARPLLFDLVDDPVVRMLLTLHGIIRPDSMTLAGRALEAVRPQLHSHGGDVNLVRIEDGVALVRLEGACNGCSMSSVTLRELVEKALLQGVPSISAVEVLPGEPSPTVISVEAVLTGRGGVDVEAEGWVRVGPAEAVSPGELTGHHLVGVTGTQADVIVVNLDQRFAAYRNECAHEALPLDNAVIDAAAGTLTCPWHGFCYDAVSGECLSAPGAQLEQLPLRVDDGDIWVRVSE